MPASATQQTWTDRVEALIHACRTNPVLQDVLAPLWAHSSDPVAFWKGMDETGSDASFHAAIMGSDAAT